MIGEKIIQCLLSYIFVQIFDENVSFLIEVLQTQWHESHSTAFNCDIIHLLEASVCFFLGVEAEETKTAGFAGFLV